MHGDKQYSYVVVPIPIRRENLSARRLARPGLSCQYYNGLFWAFRPYPALQVLMQVHYHPLRDSLSRIDSILLLFIVCSERNVDLPQREFFSRQILVGHSYEIIAIASPSFVTLEYLGQLAGVGL